MNTTPPPANGQPGGTPAPFTHTPRPGWVLLNPHNTGLVQYGATQDAAIAGVHGVNHRNRVSLCGHRDEAHAEMRVHISNLYGAAEALILLPAPAMRELARCLIDAAHAIDGGAA